MPDPSCVRATDVAQASLEMKCNGERRSCPGATIVTCYAKPEGCSGEFRSASDLEVIDRQLEAAGWQVVRTRQATVYRCPGHNRKPARRVKPRREVAP